MHQQDISESFSHSGESFIELCDQTLQLVHEALETSPNQMRQDVDRLEKLAARIRDFLIGRLREARGATTYRPLLEDANIVISLIAAIEYPASGIHRRYLKEAQTVLHRLREKVDGTMRQREPNPPP